jgi:hypothetical protein
MAGAVHTSVFRLTVDADSALRARDYEIASKLYLAALERPSVQSTQRAGILANLGIAWQGLNQIERATAAFEEAVRTSPNLAPAQIGLANMYALRGHHPEALEHFDLALSIDPTSAIAHTNRGLSLQAVGRLEEAWEEFEWRYATPDANSFYPHRYAKPRWRGEPLHGRTLLVHREQGLGDVIQHIRFLPLLGRFGGRVIFECPEPILPLISPKPELECITAGPGPVAEELFDCYIPLLSLPHVLKRRLQDLPAMCPYVASKSGVGSRPGARGTRGLKVGFTWSGSVFDRTRNALLQDFLGLLSLDVPLVSLQKDVDVLEARLLTEVGVQNNGSSFRHFGDTRDAIDDLDAVVTVDTAVAHLAGAMAKPTWLLLNEPAAVRWMTNRADTPWYPTMHICRRHKGDLWAQLVAVAASEVLHP